VATHRKELTSAIVASEFQKRNKVGRTKLGSGDAGCVNNKNA